MKKFPITTLGLLLLLGALTGCETVPVKPSTGEPALQAPTAPAHAVQPAVAPPVVVSAAAREAAERLMESAQPHEMLKVSAFAGYPQFTAQNWSGLVLNSKVSTQSLAHTSNFRVLRIEIHPLLDGRLRVWLEIANSSPQKVTPEVACQFSPEDEDKNAKFTTMAELGPGGHTVVYFESRENAPFGYSILARNKRQ